jgi:uncharacterized protein YprB with RNaseH-like and TPR domain
MRLADRVRGVLRPQADATGARPAGAADVRPAGRFVESDLSRVLGGWWRDVGSARCFVVDQRVEPEARHGAAFVREIAEGLDAGAAGAPMLAAGAAARSPFLFFDLETTGLSGGAGTYAFLVGCGRFGGDGSFLTRQYLLTEFGGERALLEAAGGDIGEAGALVSFNGKSFDAPVLETRFLFHRLPWRAVGLPHLDVLHPARRFWGREERRGPFDRAGGEGDIARRGRADGVAAPSSDCSLAALERHVLGARRDADVAGSEVPARYFQFVRSGDPRPLRAVLEHNRLDLLSLAGLTARLLHLVSAGPRAARDAREALALGRVYAGAGLIPRARDAFARAADAAERDAASAGGSLLVEALHGLALVERRARRFEEAARTWRRLLRLPHCPPRLAREAREALAIHHEHRVRDLEAAKAFALASLEREASSAWNDSVRYRLARIERKLAVPGPLWQALGEEAGRRSAEGD